MLKLQYFDHLWWRMDSLEKNPMLARFKEGGEGDSRGWNIWMASLTRWTWVWTNLVSWWWTGKPGVLQSMSSQRVRRDWVTKLIDWWNVYVSMLLSQFVLPHPSPPPIVYVIYVCISTSALQIESPVPSFWMPHACINTWYLFFFSFFYFLHSV